MPKKIDLTGKTFGRLTVLKEDDARSGGHVKWICKCNCGNPEFISISGRHLRDGHTKSCGCLQKEKAANLMKNQIQPLSVKKREKNLINQTFGYLTVIKYIGKNSSDKKLWECLCQCGNKTIVSSSDLITGHTQSCGCLKNSKGELKVKEILKNNNICFVEQKSFETCKDKSNLKFDFYVNNKYLIEYDGNIHFKPTGGWNSIEAFNQRQIKDEIKNKWCKKNNIPLIRIPYMRLKDLCIEDLLLETSKYRIV